MKYKIRIFNDVSTSEDEKNVNNFLESHDITIVKFQCTENKIFILYQDEDDIKQDQERKFEKLKKRIDEWQKGSIFGIKK
jgi:hypothetical protein